MVIRMLKMKQSDNKNTTANLSSSVALPQPVSILRRSSTGGASKKNKNISAMASFNQSAHTIDTEYYDAPDGSFRSGDVNSTHLDSNSNFTLITDPNELADRILEFQRSFASSVSEADNNDGKGKGIQSPATMRGGQQQQQQQQRPPPPLHSPPRSGSLGEKLSKAKNSLANNPLANSESVSESCNTYCCDEADEEHVRRMARMKLDGSDSTPQGSPPPPTLPSSSTTKKNDVLEDWDVGESSVGVNSNKFNSSSMTVVTSSSKDSYTPRPVKVSQFEDKWEAQINHNNNNETSTPPTKPKMTMASILSTAQSHVIKNSETSPPTQTVSISTPQNCDKTGRCKFHPQYKLYKKKLLGGYEFITNCPMCDAKVKNRTRSRSRDNSYDAASAKSRSNSRSREGERMKSMDRMPIETNLEEGDNHYDSSKGATGRKGTRRSKSVEQQRHHSDRGERQRRPRTRSGDRDNDLHTSFNSTNGNSRGKMTNPLENVRDKPPSHPPPPTRQHRSRSREARRLPDKKKIMSETEARKKKNLGSNQFVRQDAELNFDKKTGRCKKHPSVLLAKKSKFRAGSWEVIKKNGCPFCTKVEDDSDRDGCEEGLDEDTKRKMDMLLRGDHDNSGDTSSPQWSKNVETTRKTSSSRGAASGNSTPLNQNVIDAIPAEGLRGNKVQRMLYTTPMGETGWYTGEVDLERKPHGHGRMRYKTGHSYEGEWIHGYGEVHMENLNRIKGGFGSNKAAWKQSEFAPSVRRANPDASRSSSSPSTRHNYQQQASNQGYLTAQMQQHAHLQQVQMQHAQLQHVQMQQQQQQQAQLQHAQMQQWANMSPQERQMAMTQWYASVGMPSQPGYQMQGYPPM